MGASFRNIGEIEELTGCDYLTISPALLEQLEASPKALTPRLSIDKATAMSLEKLSFDEKSFRWALNEDAMVIFTHLVCKPLHYLFTLSLLVSHLTSCIWTIANRTRLFRQPKNYLKESATLELTVSNWRKSSRNCYYKSFSFYSILLVGSNRIKRRPSTLQVAPIHVDAPIHPETKA